VEVQSTALRFRTGTTVTDIETADKDGKTLV
jgi:hypothetical protein